MSGVYCNKHTAKQRWHVDAWQLFLMWLLTQRRKLQWLTFMMVELLYDVGLLQRRWGSLYSQRQAGTEVHWQRGRCNERDRSSKSQAFTGTVWIGLTENVFYVVVNVACHRMVTTLLQILIYATKSKYRIVQYVILARLQTWRAIIVSRVCLCVCVCVSDRHFCPSTLTNFDETWSQGPYCDLVWLRP